MPLAALLLLLGLAQGLPIVDPGLFMILGVRTCGAGGGYCLLGSDCTLDRDFEHDTAGGHCDGLRFAFTPAAHFVCCRYVERSNTTLPGEPESTDDLVTTEDPGPGGESPSTPTPSSASAPPDHLENAIEVELVVNNKQGEASGTDRVPLPVEVDEGSTLRDHQSHAASQSGTPSGARPAAAGLFPDHLNAVDVNGTQKGTLDADEVIQGVALSDGYPVKDSGPDRVPTPPSPVAETDEENVVLVGAGAGERDTVVVCNHSSSDVNPCWRASFVDRAGSVLCSGSLVGVQSAITTAVCANRLLDSGVASVSMRVGESWLPVRDVAVHDGYRSPFEGPDNASRHDIAVVRLLSAPGSAPECIACLPEPGARPPPRSAACFALAARFNGLGAETSAVCAGSVTTATPEGLLRLNGCEVASLKSDAMKSQTPAVLAREGAALLCDGVLVGLASTSVGYYVSLAPHKPWLSRTLSATRTTTDHLFRV